MKTNKYLLYFVLCPAMLLLAACEPKALTEEEVFGGSLEQQLQAENPEGYDLYNLNDFLDKFMTEEGNFHSDSTMYRSRSTNGNGIYLYSLTRYPLTVEVSISADASPPMISAVISTRRLSSSRSQTGLPVKRLTSRTCVSPWTSVQAVVCTRLVRRL